MKPRVFIGSSKEGLRIAEAVQRELREAEPILWSQGIFRTTNVPIEDLMTAVKQFDFAVFVFLPEDTVEVRGQDKLAVRDNVLFELGLFLGQLGRQRNFFIMPAGSNTSSHLPSDLSGITPSEYEPKSQNLQASVGNALYQLKEAIRSLGTLAQQSVVLFDGCADFKPFYFEHRNGYIWKDDKPSTPKGEGSLTVSADAVLQIRRTNTVGRNEIHVIQHGPDRPTIPRKQDPSFRVLRVDCEAKVEGGDHTLRFVAKDIVAKERVDGKKRKVTEINWTVITEYLRVPSTSDILLRIDDENVSAAPSSVFIKNLKISEEM